MNALILKDCLKSCLEI